jgi:hypothetical protein
MGSIILTGTRKYVHKHEMLTLRSFLTGLIYSFGLLTCPVTGNAAIETCMQLVDYCRLAKSDITHKKTPQLEHPYESGFCIGYLTGLGNTLNTRTVCLPKSAYNGNVAFDLVAWADRHPEYVHSTAGFCAEAALAEAYRCPSQ